MNISAVRILAIVPMLTLAGCLESSEENKSAPQTVKSVDLSRYVGTWYEIARLPNRYQRHCVRGVTAHYRMREDGTLEVINSCVDEAGNLDAARGIARIVDPDSNAKLEVSFFSLMGWNLFWGDYWIIDLDDKYERAIIGHPTRKYGWVLSRTPDLSEEKIKQAYQILQQQGYDTSKFIPSKR
jgi:apolipoprotein D and lipocalin family protein